VPDRGQPRVLRQVRNGPGDVREHVDQGSEVVERSPRRAQHRRDAVPGEQDLAGAPDEHVLTSEPTVGQPDVVQHGERVRQREAEGDHLAGREALPMQIRQGPHVLLVFEYQVDALRAGLDLEHRDEQRVGGLEEPFRQQQRVRPQPLVERQRQPTQHDRPLLLPVRTRGPHVPATLIQGPKEWEQVPAVGVGRRVHGENGRSDRNALQSACG
jgi:hypothetical protein